MGQEGSKTEREAARGPGLRVQGRMAQDTTRSQATEKRWEWELSCPPLNFALSILPLFATALKPTKTDE